MGLYKFFVLLAFPLLLIQGKQVRKRALKLPEALGEREGKCLNESLPALSILILGDSAAAGVGVTHQKDALLGQLVDNLRAHYSLTWKLVARTGAKTKDMRAILYDADFTAPIDIVVTSLGVNDVTSMQRSKHWINEQTLLHEYCFKTLGATHIIASGMPPVHGFRLLPQPLRLVLGSRAKQFDRLQKQLMKNSTRKSYDAFSTSLNVSKMAEDGFHPGIEIYKEWANSLSKLILRFFP